MITRRGFFAIGACATVPQTVLQAAAIAEPGVVLRTIYIWHGEAGEWRKHRMIDIRKGQIFSVVEPEGGFVEDQEHWVATGNAFEQPAPAVASVPCEPYPTRSSDDE